jgi:protein O-mannosyl-transferase
VTLSDQATIETAPIAPPQSVPRSRAAKLASYLIPGLVALITFVVFLPALQNGFVNWDDYENIVNNPHYRGLGWSQLRWMFTTFHHSLYRPLTWVSLGLDYILWGMNPRAYHLTSILLHAANAVLFFYLTQQLLTLRKRTVVPGRDLPVRIAAAFAALIFAVHPLRVEPVAWVSARNDLLSAFFFLLTVIFYLEYARRKVNDEYRYGHWFVAAVAACACSLLSKAGGITLPLVLLVLDVYPLGRLGKQGWFGPAVRKIWWEKLPFFVLAVITGLAAVAAKYEAGALVSSESHDLADRIAQGLYGTTFYMVKTLLPTGLVPLYEFPSVFYVFNWRIILSASVFLLLSLAFFAARHRWPAGLTGWIVYLLLLAPVLGVAQAGPQLVADRYSYLSCMVWAILLAAVLLRLWRSRSVSKALLIGISLFTLFGLTVLTWKQTEIWHDTERLWNHALAVRPSSFAYFHVAKLMAERGDLAEADKHLRHAAEINPKNDIIQSNLALVLARQGNLAEATKHFHRALEINPKDPATLNNMGITLAQQGKLDEAIQHFERALEIRPNDASGHTNVANVLLARGDLDGATKHLRVAIEIDPADADNQNSLAIVLAKRGNFVEATEYLRRVVELKPGDAAARNNLAITLSQQGQFGEAVQHFEEALRIEPNFAEAHAGLARVLAAQKKPEEAMRHYQEALKILRAQRKNETFPDGK